MVEMIGSVLALSAGEIPGMINFDAPDTDCPLSGISREPQVCRGGLYQPFGDATGTGGRHRCRPVSIGWFAAENAARKTCRRLTGSKPPDMLNRLHFDAKL